MNTNLISVIIPVYNVEKYIDASFKSLISQTIFEKLQIIVVDDGSTDSSGKKCEELLGKYSNVEIYHNLNGGVSKARNFALDKVRGQYVTFLDPDDILESDTYEFMLNNLKEYDVDISAVDMGSIITKTSSRNICLSKSYYSDNQEQFLIDYFQDCGVFPSCCDKLFKYDVVKKLR